MIFRSGLLASASLLVFVLPAHADPQAMLRHTPTGTSTQDQVCDVERGLNGQCNPWALIDSAAHTFKLLPGAIGGVDGSGLLTTPIGGSTALSLARMFGDHPSIRMFGTAAGDGSDATAAIAAAEASAAPFIYVPAGTYPTTAAYVYKHYYGPGQIKTGGSGGHKQANQTSIITAAPVQSANDNDTTQMFDGDYSKALSAESMLVIGTGVFGTPSAYTYLPETDAHFTAYTLGVNTGYNSTLNNQGPGRTGSNVYDVRAQQGGQGDLSDYFGTCHVSGQKAGATHYLANPACVIFGGNVAIDPGGLGSSAQAGEVHVSDGGTEGEGSGWTIDLNRSVATNTLGEFWWSYRAQSTGTVAADAGLSIAGLFKTGLDTTTATFTNNAAVTLAQNQRVYWGASASAVAGQTLGMTANGSTYDTFDGTTKSTVVGGNATLQVKNGGVVVAGTIGAAGSSALPIVQLGPYTVSSLPTCNAAAAGSVTYVTDAASPTYNGALTGGGAVKTLAMCNGSGWTAH